MGTIPDRYELDHGIDRKKIKSRKYINWTVADLREILNDYPDDATVWIARYDEEVDDTLLTPIEHAGGQSSNPGAYVTF